MSYKQLTNERDYDIIDYVVKGYSPFAISATNNNILEEFADVNRA
jgi:hypothetical protein